MKEVDDSDRSEIENVNVAMFLASPDVQEAMLFTDSDSLSH